MPLTPLVIYISKNISQKGEDKFKDELLVLGKTPQRIKEWFDFCEYSLSHVSRILLHSEIQKAIDQSTPLVIRHVQLTKIKSKKESPNLLYNFKIYFLNSIFVNSFLLILYIFSGELRSSVKCISTL